jgi:hypothetical protein
MLPAIRDRWFRRRYRRDPRIDWNSKPGVISIQLGVRCDDPIQGFKYSFDLALLGYDPAYTAIFPLAGSANRIIGDSIAAMTWSEQISALLQTLAYRQKFV